MSNDSLQDDHYAEVLTFVKDVGQYCYMESIKTILDVGSRDAMESIALKKFYPNAKIYAFECNPAAIELCRKNIGVREDIVLVTKAVSDEDGMIAFHPIDPERTVTTHRDRNIGASSIFMANPDYPYEKYVQTRIEVESITLAKWAIEAGVGDVDIMWMDVQGAELKVLRGLGSLIAGVKAIYTEVEFKEMYIGQPLFDEIDKYMLENEFHLVKIYSSGWFGNALYVNTRFLSGRKKLRSYLSQIFLHMKIKIRKLKQGIKKYLKR